jgi:hypothetical protein
VALLTPNVAFFPFYGGSRVVFLRRIDLLLLALRSHNFVLWAGDARTAQGGLKSLLRFCFAKFIFFALGHRLTMPTLSHEQRAQLIIDTRDQATALLEELSHFRTLLKNPTPSRGELRGLSATLRRLLLERGITFVAAPRIGKLLFDVPDSKSPTKHPEKSIFFGQLGYPFGRDASKKPEKKGFVKLKLDGFLSQIIFIYNGTAISRKRLHEYIAYTASGVHSPAIDKAKSPEDVALDSLRRNSRLTKRGLTFNVPIPSTTRVEPFTYSPEEADLVFLQLLSDVYFILHSDDTAKLESAIRSELGLPS